MLTLKFLIDQKIVLIDKIRFQSKKKLIDQNIKFFNRQNLYRCHWHKLHFNDCD